MSGREFHSDAKPQIPGSLVCAALEPTMLASDYASTMTVRVTESEWTPLPGALPSIVQPDKVYVIPTRTATASDETAAGDICFTDSVRYLPKAARATGIPVEFSQPEGERRYLQEFSIDPEMWSLGLALLTMGSDWLILTVSLFLDLRADSQGWDPEDALQLPLKVSVAETGTGRNYQLEGSGRDVIEALKVLQHNALESKPEEGND